MKKSRIVFCDFDGTITSKESLEAVLGSFSPEKFDPVMAALKSGETTVKHGVRELVEDIPSSRYQEILDFVRRIPIRPGFEELLDFLGDRGIRFVVLSGGLMDMVEARLGRLSDKVDAIVAARVDAGGGKLRVFSEHESDTELVAKAKVMKKFAHDESVVIGDGITDIGMVRHGNIVFARGSLADFMQRSGLPFYRWSDFRDVRLKLETLL